MRPAPEAPPSLYPFSLPGNDFGTVGMGAMSQNVLLVGAQLDSVWAAALRDSLWPLAELILIDPSGLMDPIRTEDYQVVILDAGGIDDLHSMLSALRRENANVPIVVMTASPTWQRARKAFLAGATDYMRKSLDSSDLLAAVKQVLSKSQEE